MARDYTITAARNAGEKDNPHGGTLVKWYLKLADSEAGDDDVYTQKKPGNDLAEGMSIYGRLEKGEFGWRFFSEQKDGSGSQGSSGGTFNRHFERVPDNSDRSRRIERQHSQEMAIRVIALRAVHTQDVMDWDDGLIQAALVKWTDFFVQDLDADVGGGSTQAIHDAPPVAADVSAENMGATPGVQDAMAEAGMREASPAQKRKLTTLMGKAGLSRDAMMAVVLWRCRTVKATKDGASKLIQDLIDGATHDTLLAEIHDAKRAGDPLAARAAALIPSDTPLAEDPEEKAKEYEDESGVPF